MLPRILAATLLFSTVVLAQNIGPADSQFIKSFGPDYINLQSLTVGLDIPVFSKGGAIPFSYELKGANGCQVFRNLVGRILYSYLYCGIGINKGFIRPQDNWSLVGDAPNNSWTASGTSQAWNPCSADGGAATTKYYNLVLTGPDFTTYYLNPNDTIIVESGSKQSCAQAVDDYTYQGGVHVHMTSLAAFTVTVPNGATFGPGSVQDTFGNKISLSAGSYTDTLNTTALTVSASAGNETDTYWDTTGGPQNIAAKTSPETVTTNVAGCSYATTQTGGLVTEIDYPDGVNLYLGYEPVSGGGYTGRLTSLTLRTGAQISYSYGSNGTCPLTSVNSVTRTGPDGSTTYTQAIFQSGTNVGTTTTVLDPGQNKTVYTFMGTDGAGNAMATIPLTMTEVQVWQNTGTVASPAYPSSPNRTILYCYNNNTTNCATTQASYPITAEDIYVTPDGKTSSSRTKYTYDTFSCSSGTCSYGNVTEIDRYPFTTVGTGTIDNKTVITYGSWNGSACVAVGSGIVNLPCDVQSVDNASHVLSESRHTYSSKGFETQKQDFVGSGLAWISSSATPNPNGTVNTATIPTGAVTTYTYAATGSGGCNGILPTATSKTIRGVSLTTGATWDCNMGRLLSSWNANGSPTSATTFTYDLSGRPLSQEDPLTHTVNESYPSATKSTVGDSFATTTNIVDGLGRTIRSQKTDGTNYDTISTGYAFNGTQFRISTSQPCITSLGADCTENHFRDIDPLGRTFSTSTTGNEAVASTFSQNDVSVSLTPPPSGEHNKTTQTEYDGLGRLSSVCSLQNTGGTTCGQIDGNSGILTSYSYSHPATGQTQTTSTRGSQQHVTTLDGVGRLYISQSPESGTTTYYHDSVTTTPCGSQSSPGQTLKVTDNTGNYVCYIRDGLGRIRDVGNSNESSTNPCKHFRYDATTDAYVTPPSGYVANNLKGNLMEALTDDCSGTVLTDEYFTYDKDNRLTDVWESTPHSGGYYHTTVIYALNGVVTSISGVPGMSTYNITLDNNGRPDSSKYGTTVVASNVNYNGAGQATEIDYEGTDKDTYVYDSNTGSMNSWGFTVGSVSETSTLTWNANRTLKTLAITDGFNSGGTQTCHFNPTDSAGTGYDDLGRLVGENCGTLDSHTYTYDQYDNFSKSGTTNWNPGYSISSPSNNHMLSPATYDGSGRVTYDLNNSYAWDGYGKMVTANPGSSLGSCGSAGVNCLTYDALGRPVEKNAGGTITEMLYSPIGLSAIMSGMTTQHFRVPVPGGSLMDVVAGSNVLLHSDWLGSARIISDLTGHTVTLDTAYTPYGESYASFGNAGWLILVDFTGDSQALYSGLYDTPAREFDVTSGSRWLSPDPAKASWNAYAYPTNPNSAIDPTGLQSAKAPAWIRGPQISPLLRDEPYQVIQSWSLGTDIFNAALPLDEQHLFEAVSSTIILSGPVIDQINQQNLNEQTHAQDLQALMMVLGTLEGANPYVQAGDALANCSGANCVRAFGIAALAVATDGESGAVPLGFKSAEQFGQACSELCSVLSEAGISDATVGVRGSSVTGSNFETGAPFGESSDIDFFVVSSELTDGLRTNSYGMVGPWAVEANYPGIAAWSENWSGILGRDVSVAGFANIPPGPVILGKP